MRRTSLLGWRPPALLPDVAAEPFHAVAGLGRGDAVKVEQHQHVGDPGGSNAILQSADRGGISLDVVTGVLEGQLRRVTEFPELFTEPLRAESRASLALHTVHLSWESGKS